MITKAQEIVAMHNPHPYYETYKKFEESYWGFIPSYIASAVKEHFTVLDIGSAYGTLLAYCSLLGPCRLFALDKYDYMSDQFKVALGVEYIKDDIENPTKIPDMKFDVVIFTEILEHLNFNPLDTMKRLHDLITPEGYIVLSTPNAATWGRLSNYTHWKDIPSFDSKVTAVDAHVYQYNIEELMQLCAEAGLRPELVGLSGGFSNTKFDNINMLLRRLDYVSM
jgi:SAM-dependent methyltransferase